MTSFCVQRGEGVEKGPKIAVILKVCPLRVTIYSQDYNTFEQFLCFGEYVFGDCLARSGSEAGGLGPEGPADPEYWPGGDEKDMPAAKSSDQEVSEEENEESTLDPMQNQVLVLTTQTH